MRISRIEKSLFQYEKFINLLFSYHEFVDSCLGNGTCSAPFSYASKLTETILLGVIAGRFPGKTLHWDKAKSKFSEEEANTYIDGVYRDF